MTKNERLTLIISTLALVVSGFSLIDSHVQVMPNLTVVNPGKLAPIAGDPKVPIWVYVTNKGKLDATITEIDADPQSSLLLADQDDCNKDLGRVGVTSMDKFGPLGELRSEGVTFINPYITLPKSCHEIPPEITVKLTVRYHDFLHLPYTEHAIIRAIREKNAGDAPARK
jgi:hypothetical protein